MPVILTTPDEVETWMTRASGRGPEAAAAASGRGAPDRRPRRQGRPGRTGDVTDEDDDDQAGHAAAPAQDHPRRHGRLLRIGRAAGQSGSPRQAGRRRRIPRARRRGGGELRSPQVRRPVGDAVGDGEAAVPGPDLREAALRGLQGGLAADPRDLRRAHADHRAAVAGRGLSRRHRKPAETFRWRATSRSRSAPRSRR